MEEKYCMKCPCHCPLSSPGCPRGMADKEKGVTGHSPETPEAMIMEIGHKLHHGGLDQSLCPFWEYKRKGIVCYCMKIVTNIPREMGLLN